MSKNFPPQRRLHLVDVENLVGTPRPAAIEVAACSWRYAELVNPAGMDLCVVACNRGAAVDVGYNWPGVRLLWRSEHNEGDLALHDVLLDENVADRFGWIVVASGDGLFADPVARLGSDGVHVTVVANRCSLSRRLKLAAAEIIFFDGPLPPATSAAIRPRAA